MNYDQLTVERTVHFLEDLVGDLGDAVRNAADEPDLDRQRLVMIRDDLRHVIGQLGGIDTRLGAVIFEADPSVRRLFDAG